MALKLRKVSKVHFVDQPDCPVCVSIIAPPAVECLGGHVICESCLPTEKLCPVCESEYPETEIEDITIDQKAPQRFQGIHGSLIEISNEGARVTSTGSDKALGFLAYAFFNHSFQPFDRVSIRVSMGGKKTIFFIAGFTNEDPSCTKNPQILFNSGCFMQIRNSKRVRATVHMGINESGKMQAELHGKAVFSEESFDSKKVVDTSLPVWGFVRLFHKNDQIEIFS